MSSLREAASRAIDAYLTEGDSMSWSPQSYDSSMTHSGVRSSAPASGGHQHSSDFECSMCGEKGGFKYGMGMGGSRTRDCTNCGTPHSMDGGSTHNPPASSRNPFGSNSPAPKNPGFDPKASRNQTPLEKRPGFDPSASRDQTPLGRPGFDPQASRDQTPLGRGPNRSSLPFGIHGRTPDQFRK